MQGDTEHDHAPRQLRQRLPMRGKIISPFGRRFDVHLRSEKVILRVSGEIIRYCFLQLDLSPIILPNMRSAARPGRVIVVRGIAGERHDIADLMKILERHLVFIRAIPEKVEVLRIFRDLFKTWINTRPLRMLRRHGLIFVGLRLLWPKPLCPAGINREMPIPAKARNAPKARVDFARGIGCRRSNYASGGRVEVAYSVLIWRSASRRPARNRQTVRVQEFVFTIWGRRSVTARARNPRARATGVGGWHPGHAAPCHHLAAYAAVHIRGIGEDAGP